MLGRRLAAAPRPCRALVPNVYALGKVTAARTVSTNGLNEKKGDISDIPNEIKYPAEGTFTASDVQPAYSTKRPIPLNVQILRYKAFKHPIEYGDKVAEVTLASFWTKDLDFFADFLLRACFYLGIPAKGATPMPRKIKRWTVIKSPFVMAKSKQNFERITYRRRITLYDANPEVVQVLLGIAQRHSMAGIGVKACLFSQESPEAIDSMDMPSNHELENPLAINKVDLSSTPSGEVAQAVLELLKDPRFDVSSEQLAKKADSLLNNAANASKLPGSDNGSSK